MIRSPVRRSTDIDAALGRRIRERRVRLGLTLGVFGELVGATGQQVQKYETGLNRVSVGRLVVIAAALGATAPELVANLDPAEPLTVHDFTRQRAMLEIARDIAALDAPIRKALALFVGALARAQETVAGGEP